MAQSCIFCAIISKQIPCDVIYQTDDCIVIKDIYPKAPIHYLIIPKKHIQDIQSLTDHDISLAGNLLLAAREVSKIVAQFSAPADFKLIANSGKEAGQHVFHLHFHFLSGKQQGEI